MNAIIERAKRLGYEMAFIPVLTWSEVAELRRTYNVVQGWNNKHLTGSDSMEFGYLIKLK